MAAEPFIRMGAVLAAIALAVTCGGTTVVDGVNDTTSGSGAAGPTGSSGSGTTTTSTTSGGSCNDGESCVLTHFGCCDVCGAPELDDVAAVPSDELEAFHQAQCPVPDACPDCISCPNGHLFAECSGQSCTARDVRALGYTACNDSSDCFLRAGSSCCETCSEVDPYCGELIAISIGGAGELVDRVCEPNGGACPPCVPVHPDGVVAECIGGQCQVVILE